MTRGLRLPGDWFDGVVPDNVEIAQGALVESAYSFLECRSRCLTAVRVGEGAAVYGSTAFALGTNGQVVIGEYTSIVGARLESEGEITIGRYCLISWNVLLMDSFHVSRNPVRRREALSGFSNASNRQALNSTVECRPIHIEDNVWIGFDVCVLPGIRIGAGSVVAAKSVVFADVPANSVVAGNPAAVVRSVIR